MVSYLCQHSLPIWRVVRSHFAFLSRRVPIVPGVVEIVVVLDVLANALQTRCLLVCVGTVAEHRLPLFAETQQLYNPQTFLGTLLHLFAGVILICISVRAETIHVPRVECHVAPIKARSRDYFWVWPIIDVLGDIGLSRSLRRAQTSSGDVSWRGTWIFFAPHYVIPGRWDPLLSRVFPPGGDRGERDGLWRGRSLYAHADPSRAESR